MAIETIEELIRRYVPLSEYGDGWHKVYCEVCTSGKETKGKRGGWRFSGEMAFYSCFNCGVKYSFDPERQHPYSKGMWECLNKFGIPEEEHKAIAYKNKENKQFAIPARPKIETPILQIPDYFYKLSEAKSDDYVANKAKEFLWNTKRIKFSDYEFYLSSGITKSGPKESMMAKAFMHRIIIPYFKDGNLIYYQGRDLYNKSPNKYVNASSPRTAVIHGFDKIYNDIDKPLFITEGFWDAFHLNGVCVLENNLTATQIEIINKSPRTKIVVPDKKDDTKMLATKALNLGWKLGLPDIGNCDDITDAIVKYGKIYVLNSLMQNIYGGFEASVQLDLY